MEQIFFTSLDKEKLKELFRESVAETIQDQLKVLIKKSDEDVDDKLLSRKEVAKIYGISYVTLREWEKHHIIPQPIRKGSRVYWRKGDIMEDISRRGGEHA
ncbi:MAG: helix-turn-helix domain-containing protein [Bacteroidales bacterium]|jgi:predicted DNA-binding transcriptional regulator AlpA|nr:helix-turn-helix domain-containing protein [Bacteroidales bacterium]